MRARRAMVVIDRLPGQVLVGVAQVLIRLVGDRFGGAAAGIFGHPAPFALRKHQITWRNRDPSAILPSLKLLSTCEHRSPATPSCSRALANELKDEFPTKQQWRNFEAKNRDQRRPARAPPAGGFFGL